MIEILFLFKDKLNNLSLKNIYEFDFDEPVWFSLSIK